MYYYAIFQRDPEKSCPTFFGKKVMVLKRFGMMQELDPKET